MKIVENILTDNKIEIEKTEQPTKKTAILVIKNVLSLLIIVFSFLAVLLLKVVSTSGDETETLTVFDFFFESFKDVKEEIEPLIASYKGNFDYVANIKMSYYVPLIFCVVFFSISLLSLAFLLCFSVYKFANSSLNGKHKDISDNAFYSVGAYLLSLFAILGYTSVNSKISYGSQNITLTSKLNECSIAFSIVITVLISCLTIIKQFGKGKTGWKNKNLFVFIFGVILFVFTLGIAFVSTLTYTEANLNASGVTMELKITINGFLLAFTNSNFYDGAIKKTFWQSMMNANVAFIINYVTILLAVIAIVRYLKILCGKRKTAFDYALSISIFITSLAYFIVGLISISRFNKYYESLGGETLFQIVPLIFVLILSLFNAIFNVMELIILKKNSKYIQNANKA